MKLKDIQEGQLYAWRKNYSQTCRARVDRIDYAGRSRRKVEKVTISYGRKFEHQKEMMAWYAEYDLLSTWEDYKHQQAEEKAFRERLSDLQKQVAKSTEVLDLKCSVGESRIVLEGKLEELEQLAAALGDIDFTGSSALGALFGSLGSGTAEASEADA